MSDVPQMGPGFPNPFGFDPEQLMRMLQSPGPVNMEIARTTAEATATMDVDTGQQTTEPAIAPDVTRAFEDVVRAAQGVVSDATALPAALTLPSASVNRVEWSRATLAVLEPVLASLATALSRGQAAPTDPNALSPDAMFAMVMQQLVPMLLGAWSGSMIGFLSHNALGQYDLPLPLSTEPKMLFVVRNVDAFASEWELPIDELRYSVALREIVRGAQRSTPWVRERLVRLASDYVGAYEVQPDALEQFGGMNLQDPSAMAGLEELSDPQVLLGAMQSERQKPMLEELQRFVSVLEGYTDVVVAQVGERMVASHARIDEALRRLRLERGEAATFVDQLLGLQLDREHYEAGLKFARGVVERSDGALDHLNRLWTSESMVPTTSELQAPGLWLARIDLPEA